MQITNSEWIRTRTTLINRLKNWADQASWQDFFDTYWRLIYSAARKSGLSETEAQDVLQETLMTVAKNVVDFKYDRTIGSFKAWLLTITRWRITDQLRKRTPHYQPGSEFQDDRDSTNLGKLENIPDQTHQDLESLWEAEWKEAIFQAAREKVKRNVNPDHFQVFELCVDQEWETDKVARTFGIKAHQVHVRINRVSKAIKDEVERLKVAMA